MSEIEVPQPGLAPQPPLESRTSGRAAVITVWLRDLVISLAISAFIIIFL